MLSIKNLTVRFGTHTVFEQAEYRAYKGKINIIQGKSGSGKSTLIQALLFRYPCSYQLNGMDLSALNENEQAEFIHEHISSVYQEPLFMDDLTIEDNISFVRKIYNCKDESGRLIEYLGLNDLLKKYPAQLSGGEKTRAALFIALLKTPDVLILDEPTASLDAVNQKKVIHLLKQYARNAIVICSTHDSSLIETDSFSSYISRTKIQQSFARKENEIKDNPDLKKLDFSEYTWVFRKCFRHHIVGKVFRVLLLISSVSALFISLSLNNVLMIQLKKALNRMSSTELIVYNPLFDNMSYSFAGWEFPISGEQMNTLSRISGIEKIYPRYDESAVAISCSSGEFDDIDPSICEDDAIRPYELISGSTGEPLGTISYPHNCWYMVYYEDRDYSEDILKETGEEGVYISDDLYGLIRGHMNKDVQPDSFLIRFILPVPAYNISGSAKTMDPDDPDPSHPTMYTDSNMVCGYPVEVTLPLRGIVNHSMGMGLSNTIYIPESLMQQYISELRETKNIKDHSKVVKAQLYDAEYELEYTVWQPNAYSVIVEDLAHITDVITDLKKAGFGVDSDYFNSKNILNVKESSRNLAIAVSSALFLIILAAYITIQFIRRESILKQDEYLRVNGFDESERKRFYHSQILRFAVTESGAAVILFIIIARILSIGRIAAIGLDPIMITGIVLTVFALDYAFPAALRKKVLHDKLQK